MSRNRPVAEIGHSPAIALHRYRHALGADNPVAVGPDGGDASFALAVLGSLSQVGACDLE